MPPPFFFHLFDQVPIPDDLARRSHFRIPEHMRMPSFQFLHQSIDHLFNSESFGFRGDLGVEHHMQQDIPQFFLHMRSIVMPNRRDEFTNFFP